jgi:hypothetical protein
MLEGVFDVKTGKEKFVDKWLKDEREREKRLWEKLGMEAEQRKSSHELTWHEITPAELVFYRSKYDLIIDENAWILPHPSRQWNETKVTILMKKLCCEKLNSLGYKTAIEGQVIKRIDERILISPFYGDIIGVNENKQTICVEVVHFSPRNKEELSKKLHEYKKFFDIVVVAFKKNSGRKWNNPLTIQSLLQYSDADEIWKVNIKTRAIRIITNQCHNPSVNRRNKFEPQ